MRNRRRNRACNGRTQLELKTQWPSPVNLFERSVYGIDVREALGLRRKGSTGSYAATASIENAHGP